MSSSNHRISNNFPIKKRNKQDVVNEEEEDVVNEEEEEEEAAKAKRKRKHKYEKKKHNKQNKKIKNETSDSDSVSTGSNSNNETNDTAEQFVDVIVEGNELGDLEDEVTVNISEQHYILYNGGIRDVHFDANISTKEAQVIIDDMQRNIQSIDHRNSYVFVKQSNDTFTYGIVKSIYRDRDVTRVRIRIREDGGYKVFILNTDYIQRYIRRPYSTTKMRRLESMSQILTCLSQEEAAVAAGPNNGGAPFQFLPDNMHDTHKKGNKYQCTVIKEDGNACTSRKEYREDDQCFCRKHYRIYSLSKSGEATTCSDTDIYHCKKSTAREYYDKLINTNHKEHWSLVESRSDPLINKIVTSIKTMVAEKGYRFLSKSKNDNQFYVMPETLIDAKIIDAFLQLDASKRIPAELKFVDGSTIFPSVVCNYKDVDPNTSDAMGKHLLWLVKKSVISDLKIVGTYDPDITHRMNKRQPDGRYKTRWDKARITWDDGDREMEWVFKDYFVRQVLRKANAKPSSTCDLPTSVVHYQFEWNNRCYRMFLESCPGKFGAFYQFGLPCDGSNVLKIDPEKKTLEEIDPGSNYPTVSARGRMKFRVHRMVLFLWGGPNNSPWEMSNALEGDHKNSNIRDWCILNLQWLNQEQNTRKG
jgi:hypothetical protein